MENINNLYLFPVFILSIISLILTGKFFIKKNIIDKINARSSHSSIATRSGGLSLFIVVFIISSSFYINAVTLFDYSLIIPIGLLMVVGLYDDVYQMDFKLKFIFQVIAAKLIIDNGLIIDNLHGLFGIYDINRIIGQLFTIFIIVSIINAINFIDGIDGLAVFIVVSFILLFEFYSNSITPFNSLSKILIISVLPSLYFNYRLKNKVFLGDSGSLMLGGIVSIYVLYALSNNYIIKESLDIHKIIFVLCILFYPIIDIIRVVSIRLINGDSPFKADKNHIHHKVLSKVKSHFLTCLIIVVISLLFNLIIQLIL